MHAHRFLSRALPTLALLALALPAAAQQRPLEIADYHIWRSISGAALAPDGAHVAWAYSKLRADDTLHVHRVADGERWTVARGGSARFSDDGRWVAYEISAPWDDEEGEERVGLMELATGEQWSWAGPAAFGFNPGSTHFWVKKRTGDEDTDGTDLVLRNLGGGYDELVGAVDEYAWDEGGTHLAYTVDAADGDGNGLYLLDADTGIRRALDNAPLSYARLTWAENGSAIAVLRGDTPDGFEERENAVIVVRSPGEQAETIRIESPAGLREGWVISDGDDLRFSEDAEVLFLGTKAQAEELEEWSEDGLPLADVNIWHWEDERIQTAQARTLGRDRNRTDLAALHLDEARLVHLDRDESRVTDVTPDGRWAIARDGSPYVSDWRPAYGDYTRVDVRTGERAEVLERQLRTLGMSPDGEFWLYWRDGDVHAYEVAEDRHVNLTADAPVDFTDAEYDYFGEHPPYGVEGWVGEDGDAEAIVLAHRFDLWVQPLDGGEARNLTGQVGSDQMMRMRIVDTDPDSEWIDLDDDLLVSAFQTRTKRQGWYTVLENGAVAQMALEDARFGRLNKADDADVFLYTRQTFRDFPDLYVSGPNLRERDRITTANPQQSDFLWGDRILFDYELADGTPLQGILAVPEARAEGERLPMIVRFYEKMSDQLHQYPTPVHRHSPNFAGYVSNGYMIMQPDVHFRLGSSHTDMLEAIEAATQKVIDMGYADPEAIGLSGHSYSGGGGAFIATRSNMFAAVAHGAAPINLVSEFNQLFVGSGQNNHSYDIYGQGRYATDPYADFDLYWDQSPISGVENMDTPVLYLHGEADPTVNWEQGLEWYNALRFLGKPIIWLSYPDEGHGLSKLENRIDFQYRLRQFFGHHLKGEPAPKWMTDGVPQLDKERHLREFAPRIFDRGN